MSDKKISINHETATKPIHIAIKEARENAGLTQSELAKRLSEDLGKYDSGLSLNNPSTLNNYEKGNRQASLPILRLIAYHCNVSLDNLLNLYDERFFCKFISDIKNQLSDEPLYEANLETDNKLVVTSKTEDKEGNPYIRKYCPSIEELRIIQKKSWDVYWEILSAEMDSFLREKISKAVTFWQSDFSSYMAFSHILRQTNPETEWPSSFQEFVKKFKEKKVIRLYKIIGQNVSPFIHLYFFTGINPLAEPDKMIRALILYALVKTLRPAGDGDQEWIDNLKKDDLWEVGNPENRMRVSHKDTSGSSKQQVVSESVIDDYIQIHRALYRSDYPYIWWSNLNTKYDETVGEASFFLLNVIQSFHSTCEKDCFTLANHTIPEEDEKEKIEMIRTIYLDKLTDSCPDLAICRNWNTDWKDGVDKKFWWRQIVREAETVFIRHFSESKTENESESKKTRRRKIPFGNKPSGNKPSDNQINDVRE